LSQTPIQLFVNNLSPSATALSYSIPITVYLKPRIDPVTMVMM